MPPNNINLPISFTRLRFVPPELKSCESNSIVEVATELSLRSPNFDALAQYGVLMDSPEDGALNVQILVAQILQESDD